MSQNNMSQKQFLLNKLGIGRPQVVGEAVASKKPVVSPPPAQAPKPAPAKPGCGACSRRKPK